MLFIIFLIISKIGKRVFSVAKKVIGAILLFIDIIIIIVLIALIIFLL